VRDEVEALFQQGPGTADLATIKITADRIIDPTINAADQLQQINQMVETIQTMLPPDPDAWTKIETIKRFIYQPGPWNGQRAFSYDHDDPYGLDVHNKLLGDYIQDRRGNCITMPFLFLILGQRLGLDVAPALAPLHVLVKFTDDQGVTYNLEATSGAGRARDQHYRDLLPISDVALDNGLYLTPLTREQSIAVIAAVVLDDLIARKHYGEAIAVADVLLAHHPRFAYVMVKKATAAYHLLQAEFYSKYPIASDVPADRVAELMALQQINQSAFEQAETLGWKPLKR
jgi:regulator of sirC expression with transglutaminase-like and TPR domain